MFFPNWGPAEDIIFSIGLILLPIAAVMWLIARFIGVRARIVKKAQLYDIGFAWEKLGDWIAICALILIVAGVSMEHDRNEAATPSRSQTSVTVVTNRSL